MRIRCHFKTECVLAQWMVLFLELNVGAEFFQCIGAEVLPRGTPPGRGGTGLACLGCKLPSVPWCSYVYVYV